MGLLRADHSYLDVLGITQWHTRDPIQKRKIVQPPVAAPVRRAPETDVTSKVSIAAQIQQDADKPTLVRGEAVRFQLLFLAFPDLLIVTELPLHATDALTKACVRLLTAMRLALGYAESISQSSVMQWPLTAGAGINHDKTAAKQAVQAKIKKQIDTAGCELVVVMGESAHHYVFGDDTVFDEVCGKLHTNKAWRAVVTQGADQLLKVPKLKAAVWQDLQVIRHNAK